MPVYEYQCQSCGQRIEKIQKFSDPPLTRCENCGGILDKLLSPPALVFKGTGWYITDYAQKKTEKEKAATSGEKASSDKASESSTSMNTSGSSTSPPKQTASSPG